MVEAMQRPRVTRARSGIGQLSDTHEPDSSLVSVGTDFRGVVVGLVGPWKLHERIRMLCFPCVGGRPRNAVEKNHEGPEKAWDRHWHRQRKLGKIAVRDTPCDPKLSRWKQPRDEERA